MPWSPRGRRRWCPGAARTQSAANAQVPTGWTSYLHWQAMLDALRGRKAAESAASPLAHEAASHSDARAALPRPEPRAALPDRRRRSPSEIGALDDWLERTQD